MMPTAIILALYNAAVSDCIFHLRHFFNFGDGYVFTSTGDEKK